ncbi:MAG: hypothetical protein ABSD68_04265 [Candidatus Micrarchaeales archaeon]|jgi:hypothetical protein
MHAAEKILLYGIYFIFFAVFCVLILGVVIFIRNYFFEAFPALEVEFKLFSTPKLLSGMQFNIIGFIIPLMVAFYCIQHILRMKESRFGTPEMLFLLSGILILVLSLGFPLTPTDPMGTHDNPLILLLTLIVIPYYVFKDRHELVLPLAYALGFLDGIVSDVTAILGPAHFVGILGGSGVFDLDFTLPLILMFVAWILMNAKEGNQNDLESLVGWLVGE